MNNPYMRAPHGEAGRQNSSEAPNAALLIDFDNVTLGMRSDLARELKSLLDSDIIKGKVTVQRAYADWRRYPQYIVPLSEASIDLIFAPAYGSSKKNATDIRMAIDGMELVFIRPEIGTFILLTGDSDFSSLVLKLKEYGKYVIGIGIQESTSDILVQNCDEYYSYAGLTGLSKTTGGDVVPNAWDCVEDAVQRMTTRGDVMRSDRLKQVMMELLPGFDERSLGFKSFTKFLIEAANKGLLQIERGENGQYNIAPQGKRAAPPVANGGGQRGKRKRPPPRPSTPEALPTPPQTSTDKSDKSDKPDRAPALKLLVRAVGDLSGNSAVAGENGAVRDSEVKRRMLDIDSDFNEGAFGFGKFSKFLSWAEGKGAVRLGPGASGGFEVRMGTRPAEGAQQRKPTANASADPSAQPRDAAPADAKSPQRAGGRDHSPLDLRALGLPTSESAIKRYMANRYKGVGVKTAEKLVDSFGSRIFDVLQHSPERIHRVVVRVRAESVLDAWTVDYQRRTGQAAAKRSENRRESEPRREADEGATAAERRPGAGRQSPPTEPAHAATAGGNATDTAPGADFAHPSPTHSGGAEEPLTLGLETEEDASPRGFLGKLGWGRRKRSE